MYAPELDVRTTFKEKPDLELDFCCIRDGQLMIGQATIQDTLCKNSKEETYRLEKNRDVAIGIGASYLVLSTLNEQWNERTLKSAKSVFANSKIQLQFLTKKHLLFN